MEEGLTEGRRHPNQDEILDFVLETADDCDMMDVGAHISHCDNCRRLARTLYQLNQRLGEAAEEIRETYRKRPIDDDTTI